MRCIICGEPYTPVHGKVKHGFTDAENATLCKVYGDYMVRTGQRTGNPVFTVKGGGC